MKKILMVPLAVFALLSAKAQNCPTSIKVNSPAEVTAGDTLVFTAEVKGTTIDVTYYWMISAGTIISGQGTSTIRVNTAGLAGMFATATVDIGELPQDCKSTASATTGITSAPEKIISADYTTPQALTAAVQKFIVQTNLKDLGISQTAFIYVYSGAATSVTQLKAIHATINSAFEKNGIHSYQYKIADGGKKKTASFEMYKLMSGVKEPQPSN